MSVRRLLNFHLFFIFLIITGIGGKTAYAQSGEVKTALFGALEKQFDRARKDQVPLFAPDHFNRASEMLESALSDYEREARLSDIKDKIQQTERLLDQAAEAARISKVVLGDVLILRSRMAEMNINRYAWEEMAKSERLFQETVRKAENGDIRDAQSEREKVVEQYRLAVLKSLSEHEIKDYREIIKKSRQSDARTVKESQRALKDAEDQLNKSKKETFDPVQFHDEMLIKLNDLLKPYFPPFYQNLPDTLLVSDFVLVLNQYSQKGSWNFSEQQAEGLSGTAWTDFHCGLMLYPVIPLNGIKISQTYQVVSVVSDAEKQIAYEDARLIQPKVLIGEAVHLDLVVQDNSTASVLKAKRDLIHGLKVNPLNQNAKGSILIHFKQVTIQPVAGRDRVGRITSGLAAYPTVSPVPVCIKLAVSGFTALIDTLTITPEGATANIALQTPSGFASGNACQSAIFSLGETAITSRCNFYTEMADSVLGPFVIDGLGMKIIGKGFVADFHDSLSYTGTASSYAPHWKGLILISGQTVEQPEQHLSNSGYLYAGYNFSYGTITNSGFNAKLTLSDNWPFTSISPMNFFISLRTGLLTIANSAVQDGHYAGDMTLPADVHAPDLSAVNATFTDLSVDENLTLSGSVNINRQLQWGGFGAFCREGNFRLVSGPREFLAPADDDSFKTAFYTSATLDTLTGLTVKTGQIDSLIVYSSDSKKSLPFTVYKGVYGWLNIEMQGVSGFFYSKEKVEILKAGLGDTGEKGYLAKKSFQTTFSHSDTTWVKFWFAGNSVYDSDLRGHFDIPYPCQIRIPFHKLGVTSTASFVGGNLKFAEKLEYWGVTLKSEHGVASIRTGQIIYTRAKIFEERHFSEGFKIYWGEMLADGGLGKFYFDYNSGNQKFDGFLLTLHKASLSPYKKSTDDKQGYLEVKADIQFPFWGSKVTTVQDYYYLNHVKDPYNDRYVEMTPATFALQRKWGSSTADYYFPKVWYDAADQDGFQGAGKLSLLNRITGNVDSDMDLNDMMTTIGFCSETTSLQIGGSATPVAMTGVESGGQVQPLSGYLTIYGDKLERFYVEGAMEFGGSGGAAGVGAAMKITGAVSTEITPVSLKVASRIGASIIFADAAGIQGTASFKLVYSTEGLEGDIQGIFETYPETFMPAGMGVKGHFNFYLGFLDPVFYFQGSGTAWYKSGTEAEFAAAFFVGANAPMDDVWVLDEIKKGPSTKAILTQKVNIDENSALTGFYCAGKMEAGIDCYIISGGYEIWGGFGCFVSSEPKLIAIAVAGVGIHGEILGGLVSASAWAELNGAIVVALPLEFTMCGTIGFDACLLVWCVDWDGTLCLGTNGLGIE
jgi:hypothetical protein